MDASLNEDVSNEMNGENLLYVRLHFGKVSQHIQHDNAPLLNIQHFDGRNTCTSELASKKAEVRVSFPNIVARGWVMHARKIVSIVF